MESNAFGKSRSRVRGFPRLIIVEMLLALGSAGMSHAQTPDIDHDALPCILVGEYPVIDAAIQPGKEVRTAKVYFRAEHYPKFYWVEMAIHDDNFVSILPKPGPETERIIYYVEAIDVAFNSATDLEHDPRVLEVCKHRPAYAPGEEPGIIVGATEAGAAPLPPGFEAAGIIGTVATTGLLSSGIGGGAGVGTAIAVGAAAAGAAAGVVVVSNEPDETTTTIGSTGSVTTPPPPGSSGTTTIPGSNTTTVPGASTSTIPGSGTTTVPGPTTTTVSTTTTTTPATTTTTSAPATTTTTAAALDASCFSVAVLGPCRVQIDASCVALPVDQYEWRLDVSGTWRRIDIASAPVSFVQDWSGDCGGSSQTIKFRLKAHRGGETSTSNKDFLVAGSALRTYPEESRRLHFETRLELPPFDGTPFGRVQVNGSDARVIDSTQPVTLDSNATGGRNTIVGSLTQASPQPGLWRFDLRQVPDFVNGSLRIVQGKVVMVTDRSVVFRVMGRAGERVELSFELRR